MNWAMRRTLEQLRGAQAARRRPSSSPAGRVESSSYRALDCASLCEHSLEHARSRGYRAMQFNFVVSTNARAV
jgi:hypothetical protein